MMLIFLNNKHMSISDRSLMQNIFKSKLSPITQTEQNMPKCLTMLQGHWQTY